VSLTEEMRAGGKFCSKWGEKKKNNGLVRKGGGKKKRERLVKRKKKRKTRNTYPKGSNNERAARTSLANLLKENLERKKKRP